MITLLTVIFAIMAVIGMIQAVLASRLVVGFARQPLVVAPARPAVTILKPLHGDEPLLEAALTTVCQQNYPQWQIVFGVQSAADPAAGIVRRLQTRFPAADIALVVDATVHGANRKIGNLINMMSRAKHDILIIADSDMHVRPDYLDRLVTALQQPGVGLVTTLYAGLPVRAHGLASRLGATQITHGFLPATLLSRAIGRQDCLGATMCLRRIDLQRIGGLQALVNHLADDNIMGRRIADLGLQVMLARAVPLTTVPEASFRALFRHELRWTRTIRALEPLGFAASALQYSLAWSMLTVPLTGGAWWSFCLFALAWASRSFAAKAVDRALSPLWDTERRGAEQAALAFSCPVWLLPLRDILSVAVMAASYGGRRVDWRGHGLEADTPQHLGRKPVTFRPLEGIHTP